MLYIEMDAKYLGTWFLQDFFEVLGKIYELNRLNWKAENATEEEAEKMRAQAREIEKEYDKAELIGIEALETLRGTHCSFAVDEEEKVFGIRESKYPPTDTRNHTESQWLIKIHDSEMEPLLSQRPQ